VPLDSEGLRLIERILELRALASPGRLAKSKGFLLPRVGGRFALFQTLREAMADFAKRAGCADSSPLSPHRLRHTWATEMLRCGISLPALKQLMGHKDIRMTLRYLKITQPDLQRELHKARQRVRDARRGCQPQVSRDLREMVGRDVVDRFADLRAALGMFQHFRADVRETQGAG